MPMSASAMYHVDKLQPAAAATRYDFKTKLHKNPQIDAQIAVRLCAICSIYIMPKPIRRYFDRKYFNRRMRFLFAKLALCVPPFCHFAAVQCGYTRIKMAAHTRQAWRIKNASSD